MGEELSFTMEMQDFYKVSKIFNPNTTEEEFLEWWHEYKALQAAAKLGKKPE